MTSENLEDVAASLGRIHDGNCTRGICGTEAACRPTVNGLSFFCICPLDTSLPIEGLKCPNRPRSEQPPKPIHNIIPPSGFNSSASVMPPSANSNGSIQWKLEPTASGSDGVGIATTGVVSLIGMLLMVIFCFWVKRRFLCLKGKKTQSNSGRAGREDDVIIFVRDFSVIYIELHLQKIRPGEPLLAERYITNPQYGLCSEPQTPTSIPQADVVIADGVTVPLIQRTCLTFLEEVGEGCFGKVHKGVMKQDTSESVVAIKVLKKSAGSSAEEDFIREVTIMSAFRHDNILSLIGVVHRDETGGPCMVFEYMKWGDLAGVLRGDPRRRKGLSPLPQDSCDLLPLTQNALGNAALQVAQGMKYLASKRFVHRDLAARNCLVGSGLMVKIADFGMSRDVYTCDYYKMGGERPMPVRWMSPESIAYARFTLESDVWAYGVVLWEIYSRGKQPFYGHNNEGSAKLILSGATLSPPPGCPRFASDLMKACWNVNPHNRISFDEICNKLQNALNLVENRVTLPRPPTIPLDSQGYLVPASPGPPDYLATIPDPESEEDEDISLDEDEPDEIECA